MVASLSLEKCSRINGLSKNNKVLSLIVELFQTNEFFIRPIDKSFLYSIKPTDYFDRYINLKR